MATFTIKKGHHYASRSMLGIFYKKESVAKLVRFDKSCEYQLEGKDHYDTNKLFGIGYFWSHKKDSARFGWRYNEITGDILLSAYCYVGGERIIYPICEVAIGEEAGCVILIHDTEYEFIVDRKGQMVEHQSVKKKHQKRFGFPLGFYFGGNKPAPHTLSAKIDKL